MGVVRSGLLQVVGISNLALYFAHRMDFSYLKLMKVIHYLHQVLNSWPFGYVTGSNQPFYPLCHASLRTSVNEFLGIINLVFSAIIFTSAHIAILLFSLHVFFCSFITELILQLCCYYCFSLELLITGSHIVLISMLGRLNRIFGQAYVLIL